MVAIPEQRVGTLLSSNSTGFISSSSEDETVPLINRRETVLALTITFQIVAWIAVIFRLYARFKLTRAGGWDDLLVVLAAMSVSIGSSFVAVLPDYGLGQHVLSLTMDMYSDYLYWFWAATISYFFSTTLIKVSLLVQYLRLFERRSTIHLVIIALIAIVSAWGLIFVFLLAFSCSPVKKFWSWSTEGKCFGFGIGSEDPDTFFTAFATHSAFNMAFDIIVLTFPIFSLSSIDLEGKRKYAIAGLATLGSVVVAISIARLASIAETRAGTYPVADPTWLAPTSIVLSCLEVDVAILCASIPIFWPLISALTFGKIFVVDEVIVQTESRVDRPETPGSETELRTYQSRTSGRGTPDAGNHYKDPYVVDHVRPVGTDSNTFDGGATTHSANIEHTTVPLGQIERLIK
ncbi:Integral membrane protein [Neofusicoccum parvum]|uniref:Integral membrane protein n=1 Tax=Neofusicoccum parvum TaxID=310453 RepID=A0ACB5S098_9PEZI|nr:Integral membrane protein [Neofusicoccum parvum]